ncbi:MAG: thiazole synthase [Candidatus Omnitrophica bacterium]|nr:thiazole synthase [Candidatus Omnitrophota bacterium]
MEDMLEIGGRKIKSRLFMGTGKFADKRLVREVVESAGSDIVTVALRRVDTSSREENILDHIPDRCILMPNTSGARDADEAVRIARLARAMGCGNWVKIEVIADNRYLLPDNIETLKATEILVKEGFTVLPYMSPDLSVAKRLQAVGASAVMPLGSPIGTGRGLKTGEIVKIMISELDVPVVVDAGLGSPSHAAECMEMGCAAVLVNTALAVAGDPAGMAEAFAMAVRAGRRSYLSGQMSPEGKASASSPLTGFLR